MIDPVVLHAFGSKACGLRCIQKGPLEKAGEKVDESVNDAKRAVEEAAD
jgi:hypothetical protein